MALERLVSDGSRWFCICMCWMPLLHVLLFLLTLWIQLNTYVSFGRNITSIVVERWLNTLRIKAWDMKMPGDVVLSDTRAYCKTTSKKGMNLRRHRCTCHGRPRVSWWSGGLRSLCCGWTVVEATLLGILTDGPVVAAFPVREARGVCHCHWKGVWFKFIYSPIKWGV